MDDKVILLVEDHADDEKLTLRTLKTSQFCNEVVVARNGATRSSCTAGRSSRQCGMACREYMTFGFTQEASPTREEGAPHHLIETAWYFTALHASEAKLSAIVRKVAS